MGNIEEKTSSFSKQTSQPTQNVVQKKGQKENKPVGKNIIQAQPMFKAEFHKIAPVQLSQKTIEPQMTEDFLEQVREQQEKVQSIFGSLNKGSLLESIIECNPKTPDNVEVKWNSFTKIKRKNYLEEYVYKQEIGKGSFGVVVKAKMKYASKYRAVKIIKQSAQFTKDVNKIKLMAEIAIPIEFDHPNIAKVYEVFEWKKSIGIVMELCDGGDLFNYIKNQKRFTESTAAGILKQIMSGVYYMHKQNVCHRDLKPENMLYDTESGLLKIIDFGTAIRIKQDNKLTTLTGTPYYIAPEVIKGQYNQLCDIWSCGVILYVILSGYPPYKGKNQKEMYTNIMEKPLSFTNPIWNKRSADSKELIKRMLAKNPADRPSAQKILSSPWLEQSMKRSTGNVEIGGQILTNLKNFHFQNKLKAVVYTFIASQLYENKDKENLLEAFRQIDRDGDGVIERSELIQIFNSSKTNLSLEQVQSLLKVIDTNGSGRIDFTQFLVAASNQEQLLQRKQLENAFAYLDTDHSGYITIEEVKAFLDGTEETANEIKGIFEEVDKNGDGKISKNQFISLLIGKK